MLERKQTAHDARSSRTSPLSKVATVVALVALATAVGGCDGGPADAEELDDSAPTGKADTARTPDESIESGHVFAALPVDADVNNAFTRSRNDQVKTARSDEAHGDILLRCSAVPDSEVHCVATVPTLRWRNGNRTTPFDLEFVAPLSSDGDFAVDVEETEPPFNTTVRQTRRRVSGNVSGDQIFIERLFARNTRRVLRSAETDDFSLTVTVRSAVLPVIPATEVAVVTPRSGTSEPRAVSLVVAGEAGPQASLAEFCAAFPTDALPTLSLATSEASLRAGAVIDSADRFSRNVWLDYRRMGDAYVASDGHTLQLGSSGFVGGVQPTRQCLVRTRGLVGGMDCDESAAPICVLQVASIDED